MQILNSRRVSRHVRLEAARIINRGDIVYLRFIGESIVRALVRGAKDVYVVTIDLESGRATCTCTASAYGRYCKHIEAVKLLLENTIPKKLAERRNQPKPPSSHSGRVSVSRAHHIRALPVD